MPSPAALADGPKTIILAMGGLGDLVMTTPALRGLREAWPQTAIDLVCRAGFEDILSNNDAIDTSRPLEVSTSRWREARAQRRVLEALRTRRYERALVFDRYKRFHERLPEAGIAPEHCYVRTSAAGDFETLRDGRTHYRAGYDEGVGDVPHLSEQHRSFAGRLLGRALPATSPEVVLSRTDRSEARSLLEELGVEPPRSYWVCHVGMSSFAGGRSWLRRRVKIAHRAWPLESWIAFLPRFVEEHAAEVLLSGSRAERAIHRRLLSSLPASVRERVHSVAGRTRPLVLAALLESSAGYVGLDTGPMHIAAALGVPVAALFGPTDPAICGPRGPAGVIVVREPVHCSPCVRRVRKECRDNQCMKGIRAEAVLECVRRIASVGDVRGRH